MQRASNAEPFQSMKIANSYVDAILFIQKSILCCDKHASLIYLKYLNKEFYLPI